MSLFYIYINLCKCIEMQVTNMVVEIVMDCDFKYSRSGYDGIIIAHLLHVSFSSCNV